MYRSHKWVTILLLLILIPVTIQFQIPFSSKPNQIFSEPIRPIPQDTEILGSHDDLSPAIKQPIHSGTWIPFDPDAPYGASPRVSIISSDSTRIISLVECPGMWKSSITLDSTNYDYLEIHSAHLPPKIGEPHIPILTKTIEVPHDVDISIEILETEYRDLSDYNIVPRQELAFPTPWIPLPQFEINQTIYTQNSLYPNNLVTIDGGLGIDPIIARGHRLVILNIAPLQYNPATQMCRVYSKIKFAINNARPAAIQPISLQLFSPAFEEILQSFTLNYPRGIYDGSDYWNKTCGGSFKQIPTSGYEYLIISHDDFINSMQPLVDWKNQKGVPTKLISLTGIFNELGRTYPTTLDKIELAIIDYLETVYRDWDPVPSYALLVGDDDKIPTTRLTVHIKYLTESPTDIGYFLLDGPDFIPEMMYGRISVDTPAQADAIVSKILQYEQQGVSDSNFYKRVCSSAYFQDKGVPFGWEDYLFRLVQTAEMIYHRRNGPNSVVRIYTAGKYNIYTGASGVPPAKYEDGTDLDPSLASHPWFDYASQTTKIIDTINQGAFLVYNLGHGESTNYYRASNGTIGAFDGWQYPPFNATSLASLTNVDKFPFVLSLDCNAGWFDEMTDHNWHLASESFSEQIHRMAGKGAVAALGASRPVQAPASARMLEGIADAIWPSFDGNSATGGLTTIGQIIKYGKDFVLNEFGYTGDDLVSLNTFELYHIFGDPEMPLWTSEPKNLVVNYPTHIGSGGEQRFTVHVSADDTPITAARVCVFKNGDVYAVNETDSRGYAYFSIEPQTTGVMKLTITAKNCLPYIRDITVTANGAMVQLSTHSGAVGTTVIVTGYRFGSNRVYLYVDNLEDSVDDDIPSGGIVQFSYEIPDGVTKPLNFWLCEKPTSTSIDKAGITYFARFYDIPELYTYCQWLEDTWHLNPQGSTTRENPRWDNPCIRIKDDHGNIVTSGNLVPGSIYTIHADIFNAAPVPANDVKVFFYLTPLGIGQTGWIEIGNDTIDVNQGGQSEARIAFTFPQFAPVTIQVVIEHPLDINPLNDWGVENSYKFPVSDTGAISFAVFNPTTYPAQMYVQVVQSESNKEQWETHLEYLSDSNVGSGHYTEIKFDYQVPYDAEPGETRNFTITAYAGQIVSGGLELYVEKLSTTPPPPELLFAGIAVVILIAICWYIKKKVSDSD